MLRHSLRCALAAVVVLALGQSASAAVVLVSQERGIGARAEVGGLVGAPAFSKTASGFEAFNEEVTASVFDPNDQDRADARVTQNSLLSTEGFSISGLYEFNNGGEVADGVSLARVVFDVTGSQPYDLSYNLQAGTRGGGFGPDNAIATVDLRRVEPAGPSVVGPASVTSQEGRELGQTAVFDGSGVLSAGRYELFLQVGGLNVDEPGSGTNDTADASVSYSVNLAFTGGGNGGGPTPIPLPPGVWAGGAMLGAIAFGRVRQMLARNR
jgi:hypothetical protein